MKRCPALSTVALTILIMTLSFACSNPAGNSSPPPGQAPATSTGFFIDGPLGGLKYTTSSGLSGTTDANGAFSYQPGDTVTFSVGDASIGNSVAAAKAVTPLTLCGVTSLSDGSPAATKATNLIRLFLALNDGSNPYGLQIPSAASSAVPKDLDTRLSSGFDTDSQVKSLVASTKGIASSGVTLPTVSEAQNHWDLSKNLVDSMTGTSQPGVNFYLTVKIPSGYAGSQLQLTYHAKDSNPDSPTGSYTSGTSQTVSANGTVSFTASMHKSKWIVTLSLIKNNTTVATGDLMSFLKTGGFSDNPPSDYPLDMTSGAVRTLEADLSSGAAITIQSVHTVSGVMQFPKFLPDHTTDWTGLSGLRSGYTIFIDIQGGNNLAVGSLNVSNSLDVANLASLYHGDTATYDIPFSITLPHGYSYHLQGYYRTNLSGTDGWQIFPTTDLAGLTADLTGVILKNSQWSSPSW